MMNATPERQKQIKQSLEIECTLFTVSKRCFKYCLNLKGGRQPQIPYFYIDQESADAKKFQAFTTECVHKCSMDYLNARKFTKTEFLKMKEQVEWENQDLHDDFYRPKAVKPKVEVQNSEEK